MIEIRDYREKDASRIDELAQKAVEDYWNQYDVMPDFADKLKQYSSLSDSMEIIVATKKSLIVGVVAYVPDHVERTGFFSTETPIMRMLVVDPAEQGEEIGKALTQECMRRAVRDGCNSLALHISSMTTIAPPMYQRMGFSQVSEAPDLQGVEYAVYKLNSPKIKYG